MNEIHKSLLAQKKVQQQLNLKLKSWLPQWLPIFNKVKLLNKPWSLEYFDCVDFEHIPIWELIFKQQLASLQIPFSSIKIPAIHYVHNAMQALYVSQLSIRYKPVLSNHVAYENNTALILAQASATLQINDDDEVYFFYNRYTPVFCLPFSTISLLQEEEIMMPEDVCIMSKNYSWLIFRSLENEWFWGKLKN